jgi:hypothetical protein
MRRKILAHATIAAFIAAGLSIGSLSAQHGGQTGRNQSSSSSIAIAGLNGDNSVVQTSMAKLQAVHNPAAQLSAKRKLGFSSQSRSVGDSVATWI